MSFMDLESFYGNGYRLETSNGSRFLPIEVTGSEPTKESLVDYLEPGERLESFERIRGGWARYSAAGYLDSTDYCFAPGNGKASGITKAIEAAEAEARELYGYDEDEEDEEEEVSR